jgi:N-methylhydantoinase A
LAKLDAETIRTAFAQQVSQGRALIMREGDPGTAIRIQHKADMQFQGQSHVLSVALPDANVSIEQLRELFAQAYWQRFQVNLSELRPVLVNLHTAVIGGRSPIPLELLQPAKVDGGGGAPESRPVWFSDGWVDTPIFQRRNLTEGDRFYGPAVIEQLDTTIIVEPTDGAHVDAFGNLIIEIGEVA